INSTEDNHIDAELKSQQVATVCTVLRLLQYLDARNHTIYYRVFVFPYLAALQALHHDEPCISTSEEVITYLEQAESIIDREVTIANLYGFTKPFVLMIGKLLYNELIAAHRELICSFDIFTELIRSPDHLRHLQ